MGVGVEGDALSQKLIDRSGYALWFNQQDDRVRGIVLDLMNAARGGAKAEESSVEAPVDLDPRDWEVEVRLSGERILTIGHSHLSGLSDIERYGDAVRNCAEHLMSFIGTGEPTPCFACGDSGQERWMGAAGEEVGPCSVCSPQTIVCPICGGNDDDRQLMCEACGGAGMLGELSPPTPPKA